MRRDREHWAGVAEDWVVWARRPGHDAYCQYRDAFFDEIVPAPGRITLEVGCGEGRVSRDLAARGHKVVGVDVVPTLARLAREADPGGRYVIGDAIALPFADGTFDGAVAFNSLMDVDDMPGAVRELGRVMEAGGRLCVCVTHPVADAGAFQSRDADAPFVIEGDYFARGRFEGTFERDGLRMTFAGWTYPFGSYFRALEQAGFLVERIREPRVPEDSVREDPAKARWWRIPAFLHVRALKA